MHTSHMEYIIESILIESNQKQHSEGYKEANVCHQNVDQALVAAFLGMDNLRKL